MAQLAAGNYHGKVIGATTIEVGANKTPMMEVECSVAHIAGDGAWVALPETGSRKLKLFLSPAAWPYSQKKLTFLGFNGEFEKPQFTGDAVDVGVALTCSHKKSGDGTKTYEEWDLSDWGGGGAAQASSDTMHLLNAQWKQDCRNNVLKDNDLQAGSEILNFGGGTFAMRIDDDKPAVPVLKMATGVAGGTATLYNWQALAMHVEDIQIALHLDTSVPADDMGDIWVNDRDLLDTELGKVRSARVSVVFRSASEIPGWSSGRRPALEDRPAATTTDGYIRRVMTTVIKLRNRVEEAAVP